MLNKSLIAKTKPKADDRNVIFWENYRITVLSDRLFRLEKSPHRKFRDCATLSIWYRNMPPQEFSVTYDEGWCEIRTSLITLILKTRRKDCRVVINGKVFPITNDGNLKGTYRTLDNCDGDLWVYEWIGSDAVPVNKRIKLGNGVCSRTGIAVIDDSKTLTLGEDGEVKEEVADGTDEYLFCFGKDYRAAVRALYMICGYSPTLPAFAFGNWWSRYHAYTDKEYIGHLNKFEEENIPFTVATIDMDWHYSTDVDEIFSITKKGLDSDKFGGNSGWTGYTWNKKLFSDYKFFLNKLKKKNYAVTLNLHPALGVRWWEKQYKDMAYACGIDSSTKECVKFDITNDKFINAYFDILHKPYEKDGVDFWWIDWQQGQKCAIEGLDPLWSLNHYHFLDKAENGLPIILSRYAGVGSHRYPVGFTGDTFMSWKTLAYLPYFTATSTNIGFTWWSHDIGGHQKGVKDNELYVRFVQFGVFSPINRLHCMDSEVVTKDPTFYGEAGAIAEKFLRLRHRLIPFLYSENVKTAKFGKALIEPLYYRWDNEKAYRYPNEYIFGNSLVVAPVTEKTKRDGYARTKVYLPEGSWTDLFTGDEYIVGNGGREFVAMRSLKNLPIFVESGAILPLLQNLGDSFNKPKSLELYVFSGNGRYDYYEQDGSVTIFTVNDIRTQSGGRLTFSIETDGKDVLPNNRKYILAFKNIKDEKAEVRVNGKPVTDITYSDCLMVEVLENKNMHIEINYTISYLNNFLSRIGRILTEAEGINEEKQKVFDDLKNSESSEQLLENILKANVSDNIKQLMAENI